MTEQTQDKKTYKKTLNLPSTKFPMKANLVQNEPASLKRWSKMKLYEQLREARSGQPRYSFHDGPPYANGSIHLGHLLNKVLKDIIARWKNMQGFDCPYVPGWDCHGLPIEHKVTTDLGDEARGMSPIDIRRKCKKYADKFIKLQSQQMQRLLTLAEYDNPYLTMNPRYEAAVLEVFSTLVARDIVYRGLKPVHWSIANQTALAEAELEYYDREDTSIYVFFELIDAPGEYLMIWTTTPWTLPANLAVAVHPRYEYGLYDVAGKKTWIVNDLAAKVLAKENIDCPQPTQTATGEELVGKTYKHAFIEREGRVVAADYVTTEDGTGLVHTAPGHGVEDYQTGLREGLDVYCPVQADGTFDDTAPDWLRGVDVWQANDKVVETLRASGHMFHDEKFMHSYPHDWRSKTPVIFRATEQWFVDVNKAFDVEAAGSGTLRKRALAVTASGVQFHPEWGRNRMRGMLDSRPDWCLSRQRAWGLPIPAFYNENGKVLLTAGTVQAVADFVRARGSDAWFLADVADILADYNPANDADAPEWTADAIAAGKLTKGADIFDVWFESGSSWNAVMRQRFGDDWYPTDLYLEGSDQHRGWFQLSLLPALGVTGLAPFKHVLTHGFMVDKDGHKLAKSKGHTVEHLFEIHGADVLRWWVSSLNTDNDIKVDEEYFKLAGEEYRKVRNTIRFLLSNLNDFDIAADAYEMTEADSRSIDAWALDELRQLREAFTAAMDAFHFRRAHEAVFNFCNETMSAIYLAATKDRLYCDAPDSPRRRRTQTVMHTIVAELCRLLAAILPHTADEAWRVLHAGDDSACVHLDMLAPPSDAPVSDDWRTVINLRDTAMKVIEDNIPRITDDKGKERKINPMDIGIRAVVDQKTAAILDQFDPVDLADLLTVSRFEVHAAGEAAPQFEIIDLRDQPRCERSWKRDGTVKQRSDGGDLSDRDAAALGLE